MLRQRWDQWYTWVTAHPVVSVALALTLVSSVLWVATRSAQDAHAVWLGMFVLVVAWLRQLRLTRSRGAPGETATA